MDTKNFDNIVKAMMEGAQEEVSSGVWDGVQKGLARRSRIVFFRKAGLTAAAVAAAAALLLSTGLFKDNSIQPNISEKAITLVPEKPVKSVTVPDSGREGLQEEATEPLPEVAVKAAPVKKVPVKETVAKETPVKETPIETPLKETVTVVVSEAVTETAPLTAAVVPSEEKPSEKPAVEEKTTEDAFAKMAFEDFISEKKSKTFKRRARANMSGVFETNGIKTSSFKPPIRRAQQSAQLRNVIRENGESSYKFPVSFGAGIKFPLIGNFSFGTGVNYTSLSRTFAGKYLAYDEATGTQEQLYGDTRHTIKYIGIPVHLYYNLPPARNFHFYTYAGGEIERSFLNKYRIVTSRGKITQKVANKGVQLSVGAGVGVEFMITKHMSLYIDPSINYYFDCNQPKSMRTQQPWMFTVESGFRFNL